jgi:exodeoxyribonuclease V alpha subunit
MSNKDGSFPTLDPKSLEDKRIVEYLMPSRLPSHARSFCMTIHKSQGSEFDHVLVVLPSRQRGILTRELIYTGVTRAKRKMTMVGSTGVLEAALDETVQRASGLRRALWGSD